MDNLEFHSRICELDSKLSERILKIWMVMFLGFYFFALFGLCLIHRAYTDSVRELRHELAVRLSATAQAAPPAGRGP